MAPNLKLGDMRVYDQTNGVLIYYWVRDGRFTLSTLYMVEAYIEDGQFMLGACKRREGRSHLENRVVLMPSEMHHAIYAHYPKLMTYLMLKGKSHG